jgi:uncharacterized damage-inducible protein DinB
MQENRMTCAPAALHRATDTSRLGQALGALLLELREVIANLTTEQYSQKPVGPVKASIGSHLRHSLDHLESALLFGDFDDLTYDQRRRGTPVETDRAAALAKIDDLMAVLDERSSGILSASRSMTLNAMVAAEGEPVTVQSTTDRELLFVFSHTLHHNALIRVMVELLGGQVPERFGYAPATLAFLDGQPCAR